MDAKPAPLVDARLAEHAAEIRRLGKCVVEDVVEIGRRLIEAKEIAGHAADVRMMHAIERFILAYDGDNLLHDIDLKFPGASFRAFFLALGRAQDAARWLDEGHTTRKGNNGEAQTSWIDGC